MTQDPVPTPEPETPPSDHEDRAPEEGQPRSITESMRPGLKILAAALGVSALVHLAPLIGALFFNLSLFSSDPVDLEWFGPQEDLSGLGHGGTWARIAPLQAPKDPLPPDPVPAPPAEEPVPEPLPDPEPPPPAKKEEPVKEKTTKEEENLPADLPKPEKTDPEPGSDPPPAPKEPPPAESTATPTEVPGLAHAGPSNLPSFQNYAPGNARMMALIRLKALRSTPYEKPLGALLESLPDYRLLLDATRDGALESIDSIFLASASPRYLQHTFLAVRHTLDERGVKEALDARYPAPPPWGRTKGYATRDLVPSLPGYEDPRKILLITPELAIVTRPEWLEQLTAAPPATPTEGTEPEAPALPMLEGLNRLESIAPPQTLVQLSVQGLRFFLPGMGDLPRFQTARMQVAGVERAEITLDIQFDSAQSASSFVQTCPRLKARMIASIPMAKLLRLDTYIDRLDCSGKDEYALIRATYTQAEVLRLIQMASPFMPRPPALDSLPKPPPRLPPAAPDALTSGDMGTPGAAAGDAGPGEPGDKEEEKDAAGGAMPPRPPAQGDMGLAPSAEPLPDQGSSTRTRKD